MGSKPKKPKPSAAEKTNAAVAVARNRRFQSLYGPLLLDMRDASKSDDLKKTARARANADVSQAVSAPTLSGVTDTNRQGLVQQAFLGQLSTATEKANEIQNKKQAGVLAVANKQEADTTAGMGLISKLNTSEALAKARADTMVKTAKTQALGEIGTAATLYGMKEAGLLET